MMFGAGPTIANGGSDDDPDLLRIAEVMNEANLPSADLIMQMPTGVTYNEYIEYIMRLTSDQITELVEEAGQRQCPRLGAVERRRTVRRAHYSGGFEHRQGDARRRRL